MNFNEYQRRARETALGLATGKREDSPLGGLVYCAIGLAGESGEVVEKVKKAWRDGDLDPDAIERELGDVLWYVAMLADVLGRDLEDVARNNVHKLSDRKERGVLGASGDER